MTDTVTPRAPRRRLRGAAAVFVLLATAVLSGCTAMRAYRDAENEESREHWDLAVLGYERALALDPENVRYKMAARRARVRAAQAHLQRGRIHRSAGQLDVARVELEQSLALDPTNDTAQQEYARVLEEFEKRQREVEGGTGVEKAKAKTRGQRAAPPMLNPASTQPITLTFSDKPIKQIYQALATSAGINVIYDPQLKDDRFSIDLRDMTFQKALETVMRQAGHFYKVIDEKTILVAQETPQNRKEYEDLVIRTFFLSNGDVKDVSQMIRSILDLRRIATIPQLNAIVIRDTADKVAVAERIIDVNDKAKAEVLVDVELLQLSTTKLQQLGAQLSSYSTTAFLTSQGGPGNGSGGGGGGGTVTPSLPWGSLKNISINDFSLTIPSVTVNFVKNNSDAELLAKPQLRIAEGEKAQLVIGDRVPIPVTTVNTTQAIGQSGIVPVTSFQYQDVGIKIDLEPRVHHNKEVTLKLTIEVSNLNGSVSGPNGQDQPIISTRTITSTIRLKDGETNFLAGLIRKDDSKGKTGLPFLGDLPLIGPLFASTRTSSERRDLFLTLTPHIIRAPQISEEDLVPIWVGTENNVSFSGLNVRLESPTAGGSPFDGPPARPAPETPAGRPASSGVIQGTAPTDPFRRPTTSGPPASNTPVPVPTPQPGPGGGFKNERADAAPESAAPGKTGIATAEARPVFSLEGPNLDLKPGEVATLALQGVSGVSETASVELTFEWDPSVLEVVSVAPGPWSDQSPSPVRLESERGSGRLRVALARPAGEFGLPAGPLAKITVRGVSAGATLLRASAGSSLGRKGVATPAAGAVALTVAP